MSRVETVAEINDRLAQLPDERLALSAEITRSWTTRTVFSTLSPEQRAQVDAAIAGLDDGSGTSWGEVKAALQSKLRPKAHEA